MTITDTLREIADEYDEGDGGVLVTALRRAADEIDHLENLRASDATCILALHEAAGGDKGLSSQDLIAYWGIVRDREIAKYNAMLESYGAQIDAMRAVVEAARAVRDDWRANGEMREDAPLHVALTALDALDQMDGGKRGDAPDDQRKVAWQPTDGAALAVAIAEFEAALPGWWFSVGACSVSRDASCAPDRTGPDAELLEIRHFDDGFHADLRDGTLADALRYVMREALEAKLEHAEGGR